MSSTTTQASALSNAARYQTIKSQIIDCSAGEADHPIWSAPLQATIVGIRALVTEAFASAACTVEVGTVATSGHFGSVTIAADATLGQAATGTVTNAAVASGDVLVVDLTAKSGAGEVVIQVDYKHTESGE